MASSSKRPTEARRSRRLSSALKSHLHRLDRARTQAAQTASRATVEMVDLTTPYLERLKQLVNLEQIRASGQKFVIDPMYGAGSGCIARLFTEAGIPFGEIHGRTQSDIPRPQSGAHRTARGGPAPCGDSKADSMPGFATDGDADRIGAMDHTGEFIDSHKIFSILLKHLVEDLGCAAKSSRLFPRPR